jgi:threonine/homoserine/homoserine lactone efflux protein
MTFSSICIYVFVLAATAAIPGPDIVAILARALSLGFERTLVFISGILFGHALWTVAAALGLVALVQMLGPAFFIIKLAAASYLLYLAWKLWNAAAEVDSSIDGQDGNQKGGFVSGLLISLSNPKAIVFFGAVMPSVLPIANLTVFELLIVLAVSTVTMFIVFGTWAAIASRARIALQSASSRRVFNKASALALTGAGLAVAAR